MSITARNLRLGPANVYLYAKPQATGVATGAANSQLRFVAKQGGAAGNSISVEYLTPAGTDTLVSVTGTEIVVTPKTGATGADVLAALRANSAAMGLILPTLNAGNDGTGTVAVMAAVTLTGGSDTGVATDVGALGEGLQVVIATETSPLTAAQSGNLSQDEVVSGGRFEITVPFKEITMQNLERAIPGAYISSNGDDPPVRTLEFYVSVGASMRARATRLEIRPLIGGNETADPEEILVVYEASPSGSEVTLAYHPTDQREIAATFRGWPSSTGLFGAYGSQQF